MQERIRRLGLAARRIDSLRDRVIFDSKHEARVVLALNALRQVLEEASHE